MHVLKTIVPAAVLALSLNAFGHGSGQDLMGTVKAVDAKGLTIETKEKRETRVLFDEKTKFEKAGTPSSAMELTTGARVVVHTVKKEGVAEPVALLVKFGASRTPSEHDAHKTGAEPSAAHTVALTVTEQGFVPDRAKVKKGERVDLVITRKTDKTCATSISIPEYGIKQELPLNKPVTIGLTLKKSGEFRYTCGMGMLGGILSVE